MARSIITLSTDDVRVLKEVVRATKEGRLNTPSRPPADRAWEESQDYQSPEVYIALPTTGAGIPALSGTTPGSATCNIYQIINGVLVTISGITRTVYNLSASALSQDYLTVHRDKFGSWIAASAGGGTSTQRKRGLLTTRLEANGTPDLLVCATFVEYEVTSTGSSTDTLPTLFCHDYQETSTSTYYTVYDDGMVPDGGLDANTWIQIDYRAGIWWYDGGCRPIGLGTGTGT